MSIDEPIPIRKRWKLDFTAIVLTFRNHLFFPLDHGSPIYSWCDEIAAPASNLPGVRTIQLRGSIG